MIPHISSFSLQLRMILPRSVRKVCFRSGYFTPFLSKLCTCCLYNVSFLACMILVCTTRYAEMILFILFFFRRKSIQLHCSILSLPVVSTLLTYFPANSNIFSSGFHDIFKKIILIGSNCNGGIFILVLYYIFDKFT